MLTYGGYYILNGDLFRLFLGFFVLNFNIILRFIEVDVLLLDFGLDFIKRILASLRVKDSIDGNLIDFLGPGVWKDFADFALLFEEVFDFEFEHFETFFSFLLKLELFFFFLFPPFDHLFQDFFFKPEPELLKLIFFKRSFDRHGFGHILETVVSDGVVLRAEQSGSL